MKKLDEKTLEKHAKNLAMKLLNNSIKKLTILKKEITNEDTGKH